LIIVDPVNNRQFFSLPNCLVEMPEMTDQPALNQHVVIMPNVIRNTSHGGWREADTQTLEFFVEQIEGPRGVLYGLEIDCSGPLDQPAIVDKSSAVVTQTTFVSTQDSGA
jgi:hypothetical protein